MTATTTQTTALPVSHVYYVTDFGLLRQQGRSDAYGYEISELAAAGRTLVIPVRQGGPWAEVRPVAGTLRRSPGSRVLCTIDLALTGRRWADEAAVREAWLRQEV